jgi:H+/Cl- antiporter ClcA
MAVVSVQMFLQIKYWFKRSLASQADLTKDIFDDQNHLLTARDKFLNALPFWVAGSLTGIASIFYAKIFIYVETLAFNMVESIGYWILVSTPILFFLSWYTVENFGYYANGSGIPQLKVAVERLEKNASTTSVRLLLGFRIIVVKLVSSLLGVLGGGAIGREGPTLQIAGSIFYLTNRYWPRGSKAASKHGMVLAGGAAGLAAAFNTPLGGIAYVIEELSRSHLSFFKTGILHAVIVAGLISMLLMGPYLYFDYPKLDPFDFNNLWSVIAIALVAGLVGSLFTQFLKYIFNFRRTLTSQTAKGIAALACGFLFAALVLFLSKETLGSGKDVLNDIIFKNGSVSLEDLFARFFGTSLTYAAGGAGGIFAPTLTLGGIVGSLMDSTLFTGAGTLAILVGMTSALSAMTQSPLTSFILILEMTDRHSAILPIMISALIGQSVSKLISERSFYEYVAKRINDSMPQDS